MELTFPTKAEFGCAPYGDGIGHEITVGYDLSENVDWRCKIRINGLDVTFNYEHAQDVIEAIRFCARGIEARTTPETEHGNG